ncbi:beta strand repeat-containing protein [Flavobacterium sp. WC2509]|uniref:beta strand repeat-containing protein n=1 Tax=Flavobacterium sp. WC2509 TaxID=3461406 RepID=UPI0040442BC0
MKKKLTLRTGLLFTFILVMTNVIAQTAGDYRTKSAGLVDNPAIFETFDGSTWAAAKYAPFSNTSVTVVQNANTSTSTSVTLTAPNTLIRVNQFVTGSGVPDGTIVTSVSGTSLTLSQATTSTLSNTPLSFRDQISISGCLITNGSNLVTLPSSNPAIVIGMAISGNEISPGARVTAISGTSLTLSAPATADGTNITFYTKETTTTTTAGSYSITLASPNSLVQKGMLISGIANFGGSQYFPLGTYVTSVSGTTIGISQPALISYASAAIIFGYNIIPHLYVNHNLIGNSRNTRSSTIGDVYVNDSNSSINTGGATVSTNNTFTPADGSSILFISFKSIYVAPLASLKIGIPTGNTASSLSLCGPGNVINNLGTINLTPSVSASFISSMRINIVPVAEVSGGSNTTITGGGTSIFGSFNIVNPVSNPNGGNNVVIATNATINTGASGLTSTISTAASLTVSPGNTLINYGVLTNDGTLTNNGSLINKSPATSAGTTIYTFTTPAASAANAIGDTYTNNGVTYTVTTARNSGSTTLVATAPSNASTPVPATGTLTRATGTGDTAIPWTAVTYSIPIGGCLVSGTSVPNVTLEHYLSSNQRGWRLLSNPLTTITFGTLATNSTTPITLGAAASGTYDSATNTWTTGSNTDNMTSGQAYKIFLRGRTSEVTTNSYSVSPPSNVTLSITGTAANAAPSAIATTAGQFYLVANPYTAPVSVRSIIAASTGLSNTVSYYNPTIGSSGSNADLIIKYGGYYSPTTSGSAGSATDVVLPPMGAIFVQASSAGTINVPKTAIYTGAVTAPAGNFSHKTAQKKSATTNALKINVSSNGVYYDALALQFKAPGDAESNIDFGKLPNTVLDFYSIGANNQNMAVAELELKEQTIPLGINSTISKQYTFNIAENSIPSDYQAVLIDNALNTTTVLTQGTNYNFTIDGTPASQGTARFVINLKQSGALSVAQKELDSKIQLWPNPAHNQFNITNGQNQKDGTSTIEIDNLNGQVIHSQKSNPGTTTTIQTNGWAAGVYILKITNSETQTTKKLIIQ